MSKDIVNDSNTLTLAQRVQAKVAELGMSQSQLAKQLGVSASVVSQWFQGGYTGDNDKVDSVATNWLSLQQQTVEREKEFTPPVFVETETTKRIWSILVDAQTSPEMVAIYGVPGVSKTKTAEHYTVTAKTNVWHITMSPATASAAGCLDEVCWGLGLKDFTGRASKMQRAVIDTIKGTRGLIILDEAQHLSKDAFEIVRNIYDQSKVGVALVGNQTVYSKLTGGKRTPEFAQLYSRVGYRLNIAKPTAADVAEIIKAWGITNPESINRLANAASKNGGVRGMIKTLRIAYATKNPEHKEPSANEILAAWNHLSVEV